MTVNQGTLQQTRELLKNERFNRQQLEVLARNGNLCGPFPDPSGYEGGEAFWTKHAVVEWSEKTKRSRSGVSGLAPRSQLQAPTVASSRDKFKLSDQRAERLRREQRVEYLHNRLTRISTQVKQAEDSLQSVTDQLAKLVVRTSDFESQLIAGSLRERETQLRDSLVGLNETREELNESKRQADLELSGELA